MTRLAVLGGLLTIVLGAVLYIRPGDRELAVDVYLLLLGALAIGVLLERTRAAAPETARSPFERAADDDDEAPEALPELLRAERELAMSAERAYDLHHRLRITAREVAAHRLVARHGISLERTPEAAHAKLAPELWDLVRPDREPPSDRHARGMSLAELRAVVESLERI